MISTHTPVSILPRHLTVFVGREHEMGEICALLRDPECRLLTLVGAGGIGKTRLALEVAAALESEVDDGVAFVALHDAADGQSIARSVAAALRCPLAEQHDLTAQLLNFLEDKTLLLVLDNLEQCIEAVAPLLRLLGALPRLKVLATSREVLNLEHEWLYPLAGLAVPDAEAAAQDMPEEDAFAAYDAARLFVERARRVRPRFAPEQEAADVLRICRLVGGMPLALELAAAWLKTLTCADIADEIQRSLDFLSTSRRDVEARHRSIRAVCDHSWQQLADEARAAFMRLSVFHGGFRRQAAEQVGGADLTMLAELVEKSLLHWEPDARRYRMHELLRQYAHEHLAQDAGALEQVRARHCAFYVEFLTERGQAIVSGEQLAAGRAIEAEMDDIRAAWRWAVERARAADLGTMARTLVDFYQIRSRYLEGAQALAEATARLEEMRLEGMPADAETGSALALLRTYQGSLYIRLGRIDAAEHLLTAAHAYYQAGNRPLMPGYNTDPAFSLGIVALVRGRYDEAMRLGQQVRERSEREAHPQNRQLADYLLACTALARGDPRAAHSYALTAYQRARATSSHWFMAYCLNELGNAAFALGDYAAARVHYGESYAIREQFDDAEGMALASMLLGETALAQGDYAEARRLCERSRALYHRIGDRGGLANALAALGHAALGSQEMEQARACFHDALALALEIHYVPCMVSIFYGAGLLRIAGGEIDAGVALLAFVARHPATPAGLAAQLRRRMGEDLAYLSPAFLKATHDSAASLDTSLDAEATGRDLLAVLAQPVLPPVPESATDDTGGADDLVEPLSERELELLHLIAQGRKNREIADELVISVNTVKVHIGNIYGKLGVSNRVQAVARAQELALL